ncbi:ATP-binding protein [uncultured Gemmiger sp.]|uniref:ATP-binding protein n=1 Tax=uncultured Gemmiger sp. TaxID=1623490 RepID=UPI0025E2C01E|nr:ATP-binding protein [uncultured Gemmiger sp.]
MRTRDELFRAAQREVAARRQRAVTMADATRREALRRHPEIEQAESERTRLGAAYLMAAARGADITKRAQAQRAFEEAGHTVEQVIRAAGYDPAEFEPKFACPICKDTGVAEGRPCQCVAELARTLRREEINAASPLALCSFDSFRLDRYSTEVDPDLGGPVREYMAKVLSYCQRWAANFTSKSSNMLFMGSAGLGKTHLALAVADAVLGKGFDVLYTSSAALAAQLSREHFDRDSDDDWLTACKEADLLILDDLGTEFMTPLVVSMLYELVNTRMLCRRPTVYTTNIVDQSVFEARYTEKVASRMLGNCRIIKFFGADQRLK